MGFLLFLGHFNLLFTILVNFYIWFIFFDLFFSLNLLCYHLLNLFFSGDLFLFRCCFFHWCCFFLWDFFGNSGLSFFNFKLNCFLLLFFGFHFVIDCIFWHFTFWFNFLSFLWFFFLLINSVCWFLTYLSNRFAFWWWWSTCEKSIDVDDIFKETPLSFVLSVRCTNSLLVKSRLLSSFDLNSICILQHY